MTGPRAASPLDVAQGDPEHGRGVATVTYPNGQTSAYSYLPAGQDHRLQTFHHRFPNATTLSRFDYTYDAVGNILTWQQQAGSAADGVTVTRRAFGLGEQINGQARHFTTDHLGSAREVTDTAGALLARYAFDPWGRFTVTAGTDVTSVSFTGHRMHAPSSLALKATRRRQAAWLPANKRFKSPVQGESRPVYPSGFHGCGGGI
ncbi:MAG: hypothetical protein MUE61_10910 [Vicinamibacterales bacterium]|nr:hypothetical protein [Vicinamibacterales bacterium]